MVIPKWALDLLKEMGPNLFAEFIGMQGIKSMLNKGRIKADETLLRKVTGDDAEKSEGTEIKRGGMFNLSDEEAYFELVGLLKKREVVKISSFLTMFLEPWQQRRFRAAAGSLGEITLPSKTEWETLKKSEFKKEYAQRNGEAQPGKENRTEYEQKEKKSGGGKINLGVKFLENFARCNEEEMLDICEAAGIMHSDFEGMKEAWEKFEAWANAQGPAIVKNINSLTEKLELRAGERMATKPIKPPRRPYPGFWKAFLGLK